MRLRKNCAAWLGLAGACLFVIGCGGGVPDPGSDANAASGDVPGGGGGGEPPAPAAAAPAVAQAEAPKAQEPATPETPPAQAEAPEDQAKDQAKGQGGSTTNEMLALRRRIEPEPAGGWRCRQRCGPARWGASSGRGAARRAWAAGWRLGVPAAEMGADGPAGNAGPAWIIRQAMADMQQRMQ